MQLGWNEIKQRAVQFSREWTDESREAAEAKSFRDAFFNVFGIPRYVIVTDFDRCYRPSPFTNERQRVEFLFALYETLSVPLLPVKKRR